jgi:hypothetical protein
MFPLVLLVIFAGLLLGGGLAKLLGHGGPATPAPSFTPLPAPSEAPASASPFPSRGPVPTRAPHPRATGSPPASPSATPSPSASPSPAASPSVARTPTATPLLKTPTPAPKPTPSPAASPTVLIVTPAPRPSVRATPAPVPTAAPTGTPATIAGPSSADHAQAIVRSYLNALIRGQESFATGYLTSGLATETFVAGGKITDMDVARNPDDSFRVTASVSSPQGNYALTFRVVKTAIGMQISEHGTAKP